MNRRRPGGYTSKIWRRSPRRCGWPVCPAGGLDRDGAIAGKAELVSNRNVRATIGVRWIGAEGSQTRPMTGSPIPAVPTT